MKFTTRFTHPNAGQKALEIAAPADGYSGATLVLRIDWPADQEGVSGWLVFPEQIRFHFRGDLEALEKIVRRAPSAAAFLQDFRDDRRFEWSR